MADLHSNPLTSGIQGIIYPQKAVRDIIDRTAQHFSAQSGDQWIDHLRSKERDNPKFAFLFQDSPFHPYFRMKLDECRQERLKKQQQQQQQSSSGAVGDDAKTSSDTQLHQQQGGGDGEGQDKQPQQQQQQSSDGGGVFLHPSVPTTGNIVVPKDNPLPKTFSLSTNESPTGNKISALEFEIIQHTAQHVASFGQTFLTALMAKERNNPMFDFLKGSHPRFSVFRALVVAYSRVLHPPAALLEQLKNDAESVPSVLERNATAAMWSKSEDQKKQLLADKQKEEERKLFQQVDWDDFVVVATVELEQ
eukprot:PhM_4_TR13707/c0_g1_i1/m.85633/K12825/SF3A1, SAP114; splicing factor 3A subunit 1